MPNWVIRSGIAYDEATSRATPPPCPDARATARRRPPASPSTPRPTTISRSRSRAPRPDVHPQDYRYVGDRITLFPDNPTYGGVFRLAAYNLAGFRAGVTISRITVKAFLENALNDRERLNETRTTRAFEEIPGTAIFPNRPMTAGVKVAATF